MLKRHVCLVFGVVHDNDPVTFKLSHTWRYPHGRSNYYNQTPLKQKYKTSLTISEASYPVHHGHLDDEGEQVIDEGIESFVCEHPPWEVSHRLHFVVDEQLWRHRDET